MPELQSDLSTAPEAWGELGMGSSLTVTLVSFLPLCDEATTARYWMTFLVFSVLPAPDSPLRGKKITQRKVGNQWSPSAMYIVYKNRAGNCPAQFLFTPEQHLTSAPDFSLQRMHYQNYISVLVVFWVHIGPFKGILKHDAFLNSSSSCFASIWTLMRSGAGREFAYILRSKNTTLTMMWYSSKRKHQQ